MSDWREITIAETGQYINGLAFKPTDWETEGRPIIRIQNLTDTSKPFNRTTKPVAPTYVIEPGDLLVSWSATLDAFIWNREPGVLNQHIFKVVPNTKTVSKRFLYYGLKRAIAEMVKSEHLHGSTMKHINRGPFLAHKIRVPSIEQQEEVVAEIEKQFSRLDEAVAGLQRVKANLKRYRASVLDSVFAAEPDVCLGDLIESGPQNGLYLPKTAYGTGTPMLRIDDYQTNWMRPIGELRRVTATDVQVETWALREGDLVVNRVNSMSHLGKCACIPASLAGALFESNMMRFRLKPHASPRYVELYLAGTRGKTRLTQYAKWAVNQASINQQDLKATRLPLPPLPEQHRIVAEVDRLLSIAREAEAEVEANLQRAQALRQAILARAFQPATVPPAPTFVETQEHTC